MAFFISDRLFHLFDDVAFTKLDRLGLTLTPSLDLEKRAQSIHGLDSHSIEPHRLLEGLGIILRPSINLSGTVKELSQRNATTVIPHVHSTRFVDGDINLATVPHHKFINGIINDLLE